MNQPTQWTTGILALGVGLLAGVLFLLWARRVPKSQAALGDEKQAELEARYQKIISQLKELEADKHQRTAEQYEMDKGRLETEAVGLLKQKDAALRAQEHEDEKATARAESADKQTGFWAQNPALKGALWGGGTVLFFVLLAVLLGQDAKQRAEGEGITGGVGRREDMATTPAVDDAFQSIVARLANEPQNIELMAQVSEEYIRRNQFDEALRWVNEATSLDPFHIENRIHRSLLMAASGQASASLKELSHLASQYPRAHKALLYGGALSIQMGQPAEGIVLFERYLNEAPIEQQPPGLRQEVARLKKQLGSVP
jgi:tetratricopeptide (TPR) repeat protein